MGLNLETLIGILVILILLILADGVRRMIRERHGRLRMRIDRRFRNRDSAHDEDDDYPTELIGRPRVRGHEALDDEDDAYTPPMMMEEADEPEAPSRRAEQQSLFEPDAPEQRVPEAATTPDHEPEPLRDDEPAAREPEPEPETAPARAQRARAPQSEGKEPQPTARKEPQPATRNEPQPARAAGRPAASQPVLEVIVFHLIARRPERFDGKAMLSLMLESGLRYGDMNIFHRHRETGGREELQFSVANAVEPGTFDIDAMEEEQFAGITFFLKLPGPHDALGALDRMLAIGRRMAEELDGELKDEQHSVLTPQTMEHLRQRVQEFERRQRVSSGA